MLDANLVVDDPAPIKLPITFPRPGAKDATTPATSPTVAAICIFSALVNPPSSPFVLCAFDISLLPS